MVLRTIAERRRNLFAAAIKIGERSAVEHAHDSFMKTKRNVERNLKHDLRIVIDESSFISICDCCESFAEAFRVREFHRNRELAGFVDVAPLARLGNQANVGNSFFPDVDRTQAFREVSNEIVLRLKQNATGGIDKNVLTFECDERQAFVKALRTIELKWDDDLTGLVDETALAV